MKIVIPTYLREDNQRCLANMPDKIKKKTILFTHSGRAGILKKNNPGIEVVDLKKTNGIADVRQQVINWCFEEGMKRVFMADDGCIFYTSWREGDKRKISPTNFRGEKSIDDWEAMLSRVNSLLKEFPQVGISPRPGNNRQLKDIHSPGRVYSCFGLNLKKIYTVGATFDGMYQKDHKVKLFEDFYFTLYLLTRGIPNAVLYEYGFMHDHGKTGGNSQIRNNKLQKRCIEALIKEFPEYVTLYQRDAKSWGVGKEDFRWECRIQWKKAYEQRINA